MGMKNFCCQQTNDAGLWYNIILCMNEMSGIAALVKVYDSLVHPHNEEIG